MFGVHIQELYFYMFSICFTRRPRRDNLSFTQRFSSDSLCYHRRPLHAIRTCLSPPVTDGSIVLIRITRETTPGTTFDWTLHFDRKNIYYLNSV